MSNHRPTARVEILLGAGGVGKTTMTAALGLSAAESGDRVAILTIDPARRLESALGPGAEGLTNEPRCVARPGSGQLWAAMLDPTAMFARVIDSTVTDPDQRARIHANDLFRSLTANLSGTHEYMAVEALAMLAADDRFDRIFIDTPPSRQAVDFLDSPHRLVRFLDHPLYRLALAPRSGVARVGARLAQRAAAGLGAVVGGGIVGDIIGLFDALAGLDEGFRQRAVGVEKLLLSDDTRYTLVTSGRGEACAQASWLASKLRERSLPVSLLIANRLTPLFPLPPGRATEGAGPLEQNLAELALVARAERETVASLTQRVEPHRVLVIDDRPALSASLDELASMIPPTTGSADD